MMEKRKRTALVGALVGLITSTSILSPAIAQTSAEVARSDQNTNSCTGAISQVEDYLAEGGYYIPWSTDRRQIYPEVVLDENYIQSRYYGYPSERTQTILFGLSGDANKIWGGILQSPQLMTSYSTQIMNACTQVGLVEFRHWSEGRSVLGYFPDGSIRPFEWTGNSSVNQWGYFYSP